MTKPKPQGASYLLLKCRAEQIPLRSGSVSLVITTPPYYGTRGRPQKDCCTKDPKLYGAFLARLLGEAARIIRPGGHILVHTGGLHIRSVRGVSRFEFQVLRKRLRLGRQTTRWLKAERFSTRVARVKGFNWGAFPVWVYRMLIGRYSVPGARVVHACSGSGNSAIAALALSRLPILLDLHHHRQVQRRLNRLLRRKQPHTELTPARKWGDS
jgi:hypothetical protein